VPDFAGFTLTQFRHSYIPIDHTAAARRWNLYLIGGQTKERRLFDAFFFIRPPELLV